MRRTREQGSALLVTLLLLVLITGVAVAFLSSTRVERSAVRSHEERNRAELLARIGIERTVATLQRETAARTAVTQEDGTQDYVYRYYTTQPGALLVPTDPRESNETKEVSPSVLTRKLELSSGKPTVTEYADPALNPPNLNIAVLGDVNDARLISQREEASTGKPAKMQVRWIYIRQNKNGQPTKPEAWTEEEDATENPDLTDEDRPIIGRYAYWVDDESTKINYNIAWKRDPGIEASMHSNPSRFSHPSLVNMMALQLPDGSYAKEGVVDSLFRWRDRSPNRPFNSFADAKQAGVEFSELLDHNKFELTHYNHDPDTTYFGADRMLLTTRRDLIPMIEGVPVRQFLDILRDDVSVELLDPGLRDDIAGGQQDWRSGADGTATLPNKFDVVMKRLIQYLKASDWPIVNGKSFLDKYDPNHEQGDEILAQIAANIIDYVRAKESRQAVVAPLHYGVDANGRYTLHSSVGLSASQSFQGVSRTPQITEMGLYVAAAPVTMPVGASSTPAGWPRDPESQEPKPLFPCYFKTELLIQERYQVMDATGRSGLDIVPVKTLPLPATSTRCWFLHFTEATDTEHDYYAVSPTTQAMVSLRGHATGTLPILAAEVAGPNSTRLEPGYYVTVTKILYRERSQTEAPTALLQTGLYQGACGADGLLSSSRGRWACYGLSPHRQPVSYTLDDAAVATVASMSSIEVDDPRANVSVLDWVRVEDGGNTFGAANSVSSLHLVPSGLSSEQPQQDTDENGRLTNVGSYFPPPKGAGSNHSVDGDAGLLTSIGELGYVNTGVNVGGVSVPWRTIRLQPSSTASSATQLPDWALLDLFAVLNTSTTKVKEPAAIYTPHKSALGGRVNLNAPVTPFDDLQRKSALRAVFTDARALKNKEDAILLGEQVYQHTLATGLYAGKYYSAIVDEALEQNQQGVGRLGGYVMAGEICEILGIADTGEESEAMVREVISLLTVRGGVFGIYTVGQSLIKTPQGKLVVTGEQRLHSVVERYIENQGTAALDDDRVRFRAVYTRNLRP